MHFFNTTFPEDFDSKAPFFAFLNLRTNKVLWFRSSFQAWYELQSLPEIRNVFMPIPPNCFDNDLLCGISLSHVALTRAIEEHLQALKERENFIPRPLCDFRP